MTKVKGSRQTKMVVVPHRPYRKALLVVAGCLIVLLCVAAAYTAGYRSALLVSGDARIERDALADEVSRHQLQVAELKQQLVQATQDSVVDKQSLSDVQLTLLDQRERIRQLEEDLLFYRQIMSPESDERGLAIGRFELMSGDRPGHFRYRLEVKQLGSNEALVDGYANVSIMGYEEGEERALPLRTVSEDIDDLDIRLRFQYFQNIEGGLELPPDFVPDKVQIVAVSESRGNEKTVQRTFGWVVQAP